MAIHDDHRIMPIATPEGGQAVIFRARSQHLSVLDYRLGLGHIENESLDDKAQPAPAPEADSP